jgi:Zn-dependent metalloprotease
VSTKQKDSRLKQKRLHRVYDGMTKFTSVYIPRCWALRQGIATLCIALLQACSVTAGDNPASGGATDNPLVERAYRYFEANRSALRLSNPRSQLKLTGQHTDSLAATHLKFQQIHRQLTVWGGELIAHFNANGQVYAVSGAVRTGIDLVDTQAQITFALAEQAAIQAMPPGSPQPRALATQLCVYQKNNVGYLAYEVTVASGLMRKHVFVNAKDKTVIHILEGSPG